MPQEKSIGAFWRKKSPDAGFDFLSGNIEVDGRKIYVVVFKNDRKKEGSNEPDYRMYPAKQREESKPPADEGDIPF